MNELFVFQAVLKNYSIHPTRLYWLANHYFETGLSPNQVAQTMIADGVMRGEDLYILLPNQTVVSFCLYVAVGLVTLTEPKQIGGGE
jgi:hypothetical protein